jgi:dethiobiotin synthetase
MQWFITGTDTGVGKTHVGVLLVSRLREYGRVFAFKPIETGCDGLGDDQRALSAAAGDWQQGTLQGLYRFALPAAPMVAAAAEGVKIDLDLVLEAVATGTRQAKHTIVEGAGGWRVPITAEHDMGALAKRLGFPIIVVARATLGTINHSLLTLETIARDGCSIAGLVLSARPGDDGAVTRSNAEQICQRWNGTVIVLEDDPQVLDTFHVEHENELRTGW